MEVWQPRFTFHGFRYVELTGLPGKPDKDTVTGVVIGSDTPRGGHFECSDPRINQLQSNIQWGQRGNFLSIPTDCPQRDERLGWMGDAHVFMRTAAYNADIAAFFTKWLVDVDDAQYDDGAVQQLLSAHQGGKIGRRARLGRRRCDLPLDDVSDLWRSAHLGTPSARDDALGGVVPHAQHRPDPRQGSRPRLRRLALHRRQHAEGCDRHRVFRLFHQPPGEVVRGGRQPSSKRRNTGDSSTTFARPSIAAMWPRMARFMATRSAAMRWRLKFDLLPEAMRPEAARRLEAGIQANGGRLNTGFVGVSYLLPVLSKAEKIDTAYRLLMQDAFPSWLFSVKNGATTIWERWDGWTPEKGFQDPNMNSFNHYALGSCGEWLYGGVAGIDLDPDKPAFRHIIIHPHIGGGLTSASASVQSIRGPIAVAWDVAEQARGSRPHPSRHHPGQHHGDRLHSGQGCGVDHRGRRARGPAPPACIRCK